MSAIKLRNKNKTWVTKISKTGLKKWGNNHWEISNVNMIDNDLLTGIIFIQLYIDSYNF